MLASADERAAVREKLQRYVARGEWARLMLAHLEMRSTSNPQIDSLAESLNEKN